MRGLDGRASLGAKAATLGTDLGSAGMPDKAGFSDGVAGVGQREVRDRADRQGPCVSDGREGSRR
jgi:hypothetical protein